MSKEPKKLHIGFVLSVATGKLLTRGHMKELYEGYTYLTGADVFTHELITLCPKAQVLLARYYPRSKSMAEWAEAEIKRCVVGASLEPFLTKAIAQFGEWHEIAPFSELQRMTHPLKTAGWAVAEAKERQA